MREDSARDIVEDSRLEYLNAGKHQRLVVGCGITPRLWHSGKPGDQAVSSFDDAEPFAPFVLEQHQRGQCVSSLVLLQSRVQINIGNELPIDDDERVAF